MLFKWFSIIISFLSMILNVLRIYFAKGKDIAKKNLEKAHDFAKEQIDNFKGPLEDDNASHNIDGPDIKNLVVVGSLILVFGLGGFITWAFLAELDSAAIAPGQIIVASKRKSVEHLEGGIIETIHVKSGAVVKAGDPLISLDQTQTKARVDLTQAQVNELLALEARLKAEISAKPVIKFPKELLDAAKKAGPDSKVQDIINNQNALFLSRKKSFEGQISIYNQQINQINDEIESLKSQVKSQQRQLDLINEEIVAVKYLVEEKKVLERPRLLELQREAAKLMGNRDERKALIAKARQEIGEIGLQIIKLKEDTINDNLTQLRDTQAQLTDNLERFKAATDVHQRTIITAPQDGVVVNLNVNTVGEVVNPGETLMEIVPTQDELIIEARVDPVDIDVVHEGLTTQSQILAFKQRSTPSLEGKVIYVAADSRIDESSQLPYYLVRVSILPEELKKLRGLTLYPGMTTQTLIVSVKRTALDYFLSPIKDSFDRAFREQ